MKGRVHCVLMLVLVMCVEPPSQGVENHAFEQTSSALAVVPALSEVSIELPIFPLAVGGFELLDAGVEPRARLRFEPIVGRRESLVTSMAHVHIHLHLRGWHPADVAMHTTSRTA